MSWSNDESPVNYTGRRLELQDRADAPAESAALANEATMPPSKIAAKLDPVTCPALYMYLSELHGSIISDGLTEYESADFAAHTAQAAQLTGEILLSPCNEAAEATGSTALSIVSSAAPDIQVQSTSGSSTASAETLRLSKLLLCRDPCLAAWLHSAPPDVATASPNQPALLTAASSSDDWCTVQSAWQDGFAQAGALSLEQAQVMRRALGAPAPTANALPAGEDHMRSLPMAEYLLSLAPIRLWDALRVGLEAVHPAEAADAAAASAGGDAAPAPREAELPCLPADATHRMQQWYLQTPLPAPPSPAALGGLAAVSVGEGQSMLPVLAGLLAAGGSTLQRLAALPGAGAAAGAACDQADTTSQPLLHVTDSDAISLHTVAAGLLLLYCPWTDFVLNHNVDVMELVVFLDQWGMVAQRARVLAALPDSFTTEEAGALLAAGSTGTAGELPDTVRHAAMKTLIQQAGQLRESTTWSALPPQVQAEVLLLSTAQARNPMGGGGDTITRASELLGVVKETIQALQESRGITVENIARTQRTQGDISARQSPAQLQQWASYLCAQQAALARQDRDIQRLCAFYAEQRAAVGASQGGAAPR